MKGDQEGTHGNAILRLKENAAPYMVSIILAGLLVLSAGAALAQDFGKAVLLVAAPDALGTYSGATVIAVPAGGGHAGFILNRATDTTLASALPDHPSSAQVTTPIRFGGPEGSKFIYAMVRGDPGGGAKRLFGDVFMTMSHQALGRIIEQTPNDVRFFAGFVTWLPDELEKQIESGYWIVTNPDAALVFHEDPGAMWAEIVTRLGASSGTPIGAAGAADDSTKSKFFGAPGSGFAVSF